MKLNTFLCIALGGSLGSALRYLLSVKYNAPQFPFGTVAVNLIGCFLIGLLSVMLTGSGSLKLVLIVGFLGAFTTFSAFSYEAWQFLNERALLKLGIYLCGQVVLGLLLVSWGMKCARWVPLRF